MKTLFLIFSICTCAMTLSFAQSDNAGNVVPANAYLRVDWNDQPSKSFYVLKNTFDFVVVKGSAIKIIGKAKSIENGAYTLKIEFKDGQTAALLVTNAGKLCNTQGVVVGSTKDVSFQTRSTSFDWGNGPNKDL